ANAPIDIKDSHGYTPAQIAYYGGFYVSAWGFFEHGADPTFLTENPHTIEPTFIFNYASERFPEFFDLVPELLTKKYSGVLFIKPNYYSDIEERHVENYSFVDFIA